MAILDERTEFADAVAIPASAGTVAVGDVIDLRGQGGGSALGSLRDIGNGKEVVWYVSVDAAGAGGTSLQVQLVSSAAADLSSPNIHANTPVVALAGLTAGKVIYQITVPLEDPAYLRYLGIRAVTVGTFSGGSFSSGLKLDATAWKAYADAVN
jgi:hypothetical protein